MAERGLGKRMLNMKHFLRALERFSIIGLIGSYPKIAFAGSMLLLGVGVLASGALNPPTILPQPSLSFLQSNSYGFTNHPLRPNQGTAGAFEVPSTVTNSFALYHEFTIDPNFAANVFLFGNAGSTVNGLFVSNVNVGAPQISFQDTVANSASASQPWWLGTVGAQAFQGTPISSVLTRTGYNQGLYQWTAADGCPSGNGTGAREPSGPVQLSSAQKYAYITDPGFLCGENSSAQAPQVNFAAIPGIKAAQTGLAATCTASNPTSNQFEITVATTYAHGLSAGQQFTLTGTYFTGTYLVLPGSSGTTLIGSAASSGGACPSSQTSDTVALGGGSGNSITMTAPQLNPWTSAVGRNYGTGIVAKPGERVCGVIGEFGADSGFPGAQFAKYTDISGTDLPGSPIVSPWLNQGAANFTGYTITGAQSAGSPALTVTAMNSYTVSSASFNATTGYATFTMSQNPGFVIGSEFTVSGVSTSGGGSFNLTYIAVAGTSGTTIVGNPLSGPVGVPQASSLTGSSTGSGGALVSVIMPGMVVAGATGSANISPYGTFGGTGQGGVGTYGLTATQATFTFTGATSGASATLTISGLVASSQEIVVGQYVTGTNIPSNTHISAFGTGSGGNGTYTMSNSSTGTVSGTVTDSGAIGISGSPVNLYAAAGFYYNVLAADPATTPGGGTVSAHTVAAITDFFNVLGAESVGAITGVVGNSRGWGGAIANVGMYEGEPFPMASGGVPSSTAFNQICGKTQEFHTWASNNGGVWRSLYPLSDGGIWGDDGNAQITGYITNVGGSAATLNVVSTPAGSLAVATGTQTAYLSGLGLVPSSAPTITLTTSASSTYSITPNTTAALGSSGSSVTFSVGAYQPMATQAKTSVATSVVQGYISGSTLTVTGVPTSGSAAYATFTGTYSGAATTANLTTSAPTGTIAIGMCLWDGGVNITAQYPLCINGGSGTSWTVNGGTSLFNFYSAIGPETMYGTFSAVVPGEYVLNSSVSTPIQILGYGSTTACATTGFPLCGTYTVSNPGGLSIGSSGSPVTFSLSGVGSGGAIAPGAALTVDNPGTGEIFPITNWGASTGAMMLAGAYNTGLLGGTPSHIQALVSATPGGAAVAGCTPCAWTSVSSEVISGGKWSGSVVGIPTGGPYWVSIRAANGTAYATLTNAVFVGANVAGFGEGNAVDQLIPQTGFTNNQTYFQGLGSMVGFQIGGQPGNNNAGGLYVPGPAFLRNWSPSFPGQLVVDRFGVFGGASSATNDGAAWLLQNGSAQLGGAPLGLDDMFKNGSGFQNQFYGGVTQTQTVGVGDGSSTTFSSGAGFGGSVGGSTGAGAATGSITAAVAVTTGVMTVATTSFTTAGANGWWFLDIGQKVACGSPLPSCGAGAPSTYSGIITGMGTGVGAGGTYTLTPAPSSAIPTGTTLTVTQSNLGFNGAWGYGAVVTGTINNSTNVLTISAQTSTTGVISGVVAPLETITDSSNNSATITACLTNCSLTGWNQATSTWQLSGNLGVGDTSTTTFNAAPAGGALWPSFTIQPVTIPIYTSTGTGLEGNPLIGVGTFQVLVNGVAVCQDNSTFAYNIQIGNCADLGGGVVSSGWVNYVTGAYSITFASAPANNSTIVAKWTNLMSQDITGANEQIDFVGGSSATSGVWASVAAKTGGVNAYFNGQQCGGGWPDSMLVAARQLNYLFNTRMSTLHNGQTGQPLLLPGQWRGMGTQAMLGYFSFTANLDCEQQNEDQALNSTFSATFGSAAGSSAPFTAVMTLSGAATGPMWEGEVLECNPYSATCTVPQGTEIKSLCTVALCGSASPSGFGISGSTYAVTSDRNSFSGASGTIAMHNAMYYTGAGGAFYVGPYNDLSMQNGAGGGYAVETGAGTNGALRYGHRAGVEIGAALSGNLSKGSDPTIDRTNFTGCDAASVSQGVSPCFDIGNTYAASHAATWSGSTITVAGGLSAGARPFVPGMAISCSGCNSGLFATAISAPPTQSTTSGAGQVGQTFTISASGTVGGSGSGTVTGGCSGTSGTGSNCIDIKFDINTTGTYGTAAALNTCGVNALEGTNTNLPSAGPYIYPNGVCLPTGVGAFVRGFRIGSAQTMDNPVSNLGSSYDFGVDPGTAYGVINQSEAFTCNLVAATIVQCVKGPAYTAGVPILGSWATAATYVQYGDPNNALSFMTGIEGYPGGQSFPFTAGSGYPARTSYVTGAVCTLNTVAGTTPQPPAMKFDIGSGGAIINAYPSQIGSSFFGTTGCSFPLSFSGTGKWTTGSPGTFTLSSISGGTIATGEVLTFSGGAVLTIGKSAANTGIVVNSTYSATCTGACTTFATAQSFTVGPQTGSGGAITTPPLLWSTGITTPEGVGGFATNDSDNNLSGGPALYDNSGLNGNPLAGKFLLPTGSYEAPGLPVHPFGMVMGAMVGG